MSNMHNLYDFWYTDIVSVIYKLKYLYLVFLKIDLVTLSFHILYNQTNVLYIIYIIKF